MSDVLVECPAAEAGDSGACPAPAVLIGQRCVLRPLQPGDAPALLRIYRDERVLRDMHDAPFDAGFWCDPHAVMKAQGAAWAIQHQGETIGCSMVSPNTGVFRCNAEVGYWIKPSHWGLGIATETLTRVTAWAWRARPELARLYLTIYTANAASRRVAARCSYVLEGVLPNGVVKSGRPTDYALYGSYRNPDRGPASPRSRTGNFALQAATREPNP